MTDWLAETIWYASHEDEGSISATGAQHIARKIRDATISEEAIERTAIEIFSQCNDQAWDERDWEYWLGENVKNVWRKYARAAIFATVGDTPVVTEGPSSAGVAVALTADERDWLIMAARMARHETEHPTAIDTLRKMQVVGYERQRDSGRTQGTVPEVGGTQ